MHWDEIFSFYDFRNFLGSTFYISEILNYFDLNHSYANFKKVKNYLIKKNIAFLNRNDFYSGTEINPKSKFFLKQNFLQNKSFVIRPANFEIKNNILILGSRFNWISINDSLFPYPYIYFEDHILKRDYFTIPYSQAKYYFYLENETEYLNNILNQHSDNSRNFDKMTCTSNVKVKVVNMKLVYAKLNITEGDHIRISFPSSSPEAFKIENKKENILVDNELERLQKIFDEKMKKICVRLKTFSNKVNAISNLFFLENKSLFGKTQLSIEEMILNSKEISVIDYGYESLLWINNFPEPISNFWNMSVDVDDTDDEKFFNEKKLPINNEILQIIITKFLYDAFLNPNITNEFLDKTLENTFLSNPNLTCDDKNYFFKIVQKEKESVKKIFNPFSQTKAEVRVRQIIINLYFEVISFVFSLMKQNFIPSSFENQQGIRLNQLLARVVTITQLYSNGQYSVNTFFEFISSFKNIEESFKMIKSSIEIQIQNMKKYF